MIEDSKPAAGPFAALAFCPHSTGLLSPQAVGIQIRLRPRAAIFAIETFANNLMLGGTAGYLVRAAYVSTHLHRDRADAPTSPYLLKT